MAKRPKYELRTERLILTPPAIPDPEPEPPRPKLKARPVRPEPDWRLAMQRHLAKEERKAAQRRGEIPSTASQVAGAVVIGAGLGLATVSAAAYIANRPNRVNGPFGSPKVF